MERIMKKVISKCRHWDRDLIAAVAACLLIFAMFHLFDTFEGIYAFTRAYEHLELDEFFLLLLSMPLPVAWLAYRRSNATEREFRKRLVLEKALAQSHKMESLGTLAGGVAHELNNQLLPVISMSEILRDDADQNSPQRRKLDLILSSASNAKQTVEKILAFSHGGEMHGTSADVAVICRETRDLLLVTCPPSVNLTMRLDEPLGRVGMPPHDLQSVIINPVVNAFDVLENGPGNVLIDASVVDSGEPPLWPGAQDGPYVRIRVHDTGPGMTPEVKERIFDPFFTLKPVREGVGLGMSIVYGLVKAAAGYVVVDTALGEGSVITVFLPQVGYESETEDPDLTKD